MRIGLFGGSFDPIHNGHLALMEAAKEEFKLDKIISIPCGTSPYKDKIINTNYIHRLNMIYKAIKNLDYINISRYEIDKKYSYTIDTVKHFKMKFKIYNKLSILLLCGPDAYKSFSTWKDWRDILDIVTVKFAGYDFMKKKCIIRSTMIRNKVVEGKSIARYVDPKVYTYILKHDLYSFLMKGVK